jgi:two-component system sensor histidine kinase PilS (NtrC family)
MRQYLLFRLLIIILSFLMVTFYLTCVTPVAKEVTCIYLYTLLGLYLALGLLSFFTFPRWKHSWLLFRQQVLIDFGIQALLIWSTGGVVSIFSPILFVTLAAATGVASARGAFILATLTTFLLGGTTLAYALGLVPPSSSWAKWIFAGESSAFIVSYLIASVLALYAISTLGSKLSLGLRQAEYLQQEIIESMAEGLLAVNREGRVVHLNGEARKLLALSGTEAFYRGKPLAQVLGNSPETQQESTELASLYKALVEGRRRRFETALTDQQGRTKPVEVKISSLLDDKGTLRCSIGLFSDLSLKKEIEAAERRIQRLEELQVMAMGIAHEIRNPLASIRGCVQEIARRHSGGPLERQFSEIVLKESDRLDRILEDFLHYARSRPVDLIPIDLISVIDEAVVLLRSRPELAARQLDWNPSLERPRIFGDRDRLIQVFLNLGLNAIEATACEGGRMGIELRRSPCPPFPPQRPDLEAAVSGIEVIFWDNGEGMSEAEKNNVFTPFFTTKQDGSGLGLSIIYRIVREHMGMVDVESALGKGTRVRIRLPEIAAVERQSPGERRGARIVRSEEAAYA